MTPENNKEYQKYIIFYSERCEGSQCNGDYVKIIESKIEPTEQMIGKMIGTGTCTNVTYPGCEDAGGSHIMNFKVEPFSEQRAKELGLENKVFKRL